MENIESSLKKPETKIAPEFSSVIDLERLGEDYENNNGSLADHMLRDIEINLEKYEDKLSQEAKDLLGQARRLGMLLQEKFNELKDVLERGQAGLKFYKEHAKEIARLHMSTRQLFENEKVILKTESSPEELITDEDREKIAKIIEEKSDEEGFVNFGEIAHGIFNQQSQYASRYIDGVIPGWPNLGEDLRFKGSAEDYHFVRIHKDDIEEFIRRKRDYTKNPEKSNDKIREE